MDGEEHPVLCIRAFIHGYALFLETHRGDYGIPGGLVLPFCGIRDEEVPGVGNVFEPRVSVFGQWPSVLTRNFAPTVSAIDRPRENT